MKTRGLLYCVFMALLGYSAHAMSDDVGLVKQGAFLLSSQPDTFKDGVKVHSLIGYLPTGARISLGTEKEITNLKSSKVEKYSYVKSEMGISGLLRQDLLVRSEGRKLAISVASFEIPVHQPFATLEKDAVRFKVGRYGGNYFEVVGETENGFYDVVLHRTNYVGTGLPPTEKARLKKLLVASEQVVFLDPEDEDLLSDLDRKWLPLEHSKESFISNLSSELTEKVGVERVDIEQLLGDIDNFQCLLGSTANGELGFKVFSNGFSLKLDSKLKEVGVKYLFESQKLVAGNHTRLFSGLGVVKCDGIRPLRLQHFSLQEKVDVGARRFSIRLADLESSKSKWINTLQGEAIADKMIRISGWDDYRKVLDELNNRAQRGQSYLAELPEKERMFLLNYIVSRIGYFEHRDLMIDAT